MSSHQATPTAATGAPDQGPEVRRVRVGDIEIAYETFGDPSAPPLLLVMGLGAQMLVWPDEFCQALAEAGHHVVRFDNRDVGLSTHLDDVPPPRLRDLLLRRRRAPYRIDDLADDALGLIEALGMASAHVVGVSMGGFIAQTMALRQPERVRSLTLIMTSTGSLRVGRAKPRLIARIVRFRVASDRDQAIALRIDVDRLIGSVGYPFDEERARDLAGRAYDRAYDPAGHLRQVWAITAQPDRTRDLVRVTVPTLVVHGLEDPLVDVSGGLALAKAIPAATFIGFHGMGHDLPRPLWPELVREITALTGAAEAGHVGAAHVSSLDARRRRRWRRRGRSS